MKHSFLKLMTVVCITAAAFSSCSNGKCEKCEANNINLDSVKAAITASNKVFGACFANGDSTAFANCYTSDACLNVTNMPRMCGTQAITAFFNGGRKMGINNAVITTEEVMGGKDAVVETGKYEMFVGNNVSAEKGKFIVIWKEVDGKWKMHRDIWNSDAPPPAAPPAKK